MLKDERFGKVTFTRRDALKIAGAAGVMAALPWGGVLEAAAARSRPERPAGGRILPVCDRGHRGDRDQRRGA